MGKRLKPKLLILTRATTLVFKIFRAQFKFLEKIRSQTLTPGLTVTPSSLSRAHTHGRHRAASRARRPRGRRRLPSHSAPSRGYRPAASHPSRALALSRHHGHADAMPRVPRGLATLVPATTGAEHVKVVKIEINNLYIISSILKTTPSSFMN